MNEMTAETDWVRPRPTPRDFRVDLALAAALLVSAILSETLYRLVGIFDDPAPRWLALLWAVAVTIPLALRRSHPLVSAVIVSAAFIAGGLLHVPELLIGNITLFLALYSVGAWISNRRLAFLVRAAIIVAMLVWLLVAMFQGVTSGQGEDSGVERLGGMTPYVAFSLIQLLTNLLYFGAAFYFGDRAFQSARERAELEGRTRALEEERARSAEQAIALDRVRIARELHDAVAHHVSVIGVQAGAARTVLEAEPATAREALLTIEQTARSAIDELHGLLTTLRDPGSDSPDARGVPATSGVDGLPALVADANSAGTPTRLDMVGEPRPIPALASLNLYRIAQEALTNVRKHAGPDARADVCLRYAESHVELEVSNTGAVRARRSPGGLGQLGMRERVAASGGSLELGPRSRGGYLVRARIPLPGSAP